MKTLLFLCALTTIGGTYAATVTTLIGTGKGGFSDTEVNNPYGLAIGPDGALYFCDLENSRIRKIDLATKRVSTIAGNGQKAYKGDGGPAIEASLNMPHELLFDAKGDLYIAERDNHVIRKVDMKTGVISTAAGTGMRGFAGDGGLGVKAQFNQPHSIVLDRDGSMLICDIGNHRIRRLRLDSGIIETYVGTGEAATPPEGAPVNKAPLNGPRSMVMGSHGDLYVALREGNSIFRIGREDQKFHRVAGTGEAGYTGDAGPALNARFGGTPASPGAARSAGPKGLAYGPDGNLYVVDTESNAIRRIDLKTRIISTVLGTGERGDGPETSPLACKLSRPHAILFVRNQLYVADSEADRIRILRLN